MRKSVVIKAIIEKDGDGFYAYCPSLKGLHIDGKTQEEVIKNVSDAIPIHIASMIKHGEELPDDSIQQVKRNEFVYNSCIDTRKLLAHA